LKLNNYKDSTIFSGVLTDGAGKQSLATGDAIVDSGGGSINRFLSIITIPNTAGYEQF
jgi:hypothetical protein